MRENNYSNFEIKTKNEMQKIHLHIPPNNRRRNHIIPGEEAAVARSVARELEEMERERVALANAAEIERLERIERVCELRERDCRIARLSRRRRNCVCRYEYDLIRYERELERRREFVDPTIYYRFVNQTLYNNLTGESNINVTKLAYKALAEQENVEDILRKYRNRA